MKPMARLEPLGAQLLLTNSPVVGGEEEVDEEDAPNERVRPRERRVAETICVAFEMLALHTVFAFGSN